MKRRVSVRACCWGTSISRRGTSAAAKKRSDAYLFVDPRTLSLFFLSPPLFLTFPRPPTSFLASTILILLSSCFKFISGRVSDTSSIILTDQAQKSSFSWFHIPHLLIEASPRFVYPLPVVHFFYSAFPFYSFR